MGTIQMSTRVNASQERVFEVFTDLENAATNVEGIESIELLGEGPVAEGTRWKETRVIFKKKAVEEMWISKFDPPRSYTVQADTCGCDFFTTFTFTPEGEGTRVEMTMLSKARGFMAKLMTPLGWMFSGSMKKLMQKDLDDLKKVAEAA